MIQSSSACPIICFWWILFNKSFSLVINCSSILYESSLNQCCDLLDCPWNKYLISVKLVLFFFCLLTMKVFCLFPPQLECHLYVSFLCLPHNNASCLCIPQLEILRNTHYIHLIHKDLPFFSLTQLYFHLIASCFCTPHNIYPYLFYSKFIPISSQHAIIILPQEQLLLFSSYSHFGYSV